MSHAHEPLELYRYQKVNDRFASLSLADLVSARDLYHAHLMQHANVVATAIGRYRIRVEDSWPQDERRVKGTYPRTLANSEVRAYSWPCVLVFVERWEDREALSARAQQPVPKTLYMPDGRCVPVCLVQAPKEDPADVRAPQQVAYPTNNIGPGHPILAEVQGRRYLATLGCLVSDGHRVYGLTNRHVTGEQGEPVFTRLAGDVVRIGESSAKQLTRKPFEEVYPSLPGHGTFVNLDLGLVDLDDLDRWTTRVRGIPEALGPMADFSDGNLTLNLIGCHVRGAGAAGGDMSGEIHALFYRYKTRGGFEYVADLMIGPRAARRGGKEPKFATLPGDSGTLWMLEPVRRDAADADGAGAAHYVPLALQWGRNMLASGGAAQAQGFALATLLSRACDLLDVDPVRDWNLDQTDTWGAMGHFAIGARSIGALSSRFPRLRKLMQNNATIVSHDEATLLKGDFQGMGSADFVPMADVPDFFWKPNVAKQGFTRPAEGPNHFADMDQKGPDGRTLLDLTENVAGIDPGVWDRFYDSVQDLDKGGPIQPQHRGLLPFRVWQIFDAMVGFAKQGAGDEFVCAAGVLAHYIGDACQPLHISYLHDGDPLDKVERTVTRGKKAGQVVEEPKGKGIHSLYEDTMVSLYRAELLKELQNTKAPAKDETVVDGFEAARKTIDLMRSTFGKIAPADLVATFVEFGHGGKAGATELWDHYGAATQEVMKDGAHLLAVLWEAAWSNGGGEANVSSTARLTETAAMDIVSRSDFLPSYTIDQIGAVLSQPVKKHVSMKEVVRARTRSGARGSRGKVRR